ncbi:MAG: hypothetical protein ACREJD_09575 [Phycisphaerales bacterium]
MKALHGCMKSAVTLFALTAMAAATIALTESRAQAAIVPQCGPTIAWSCTLPNGTTKFVGATVCAIRQYEQKTGAKCVPY